MKVNFIFENVYATSKQIYGAKDKRPDRCLKQKKIYSVRQEIICWVSHG